MDLGCYGARRLLSVARLELEEPALTSLVVLGRRWIEVGTELETSHGHGVYSRVGVAR